ncbi:HlyD family type I secretion periplasmic adaptor subunit [Ruegeria sp.]|uniref:HlyD family type I secretion periplasmic adaptor subunit n=1 Tax=Ruegeria sp. TaxID=1879320 RepID=UPI0023149A8B|nr:HlyD family type I secretion periplasmic adaptor subunit [Ruegeria sp.]MDA7966702.1 HlyD family type I secretion periplasmic adaptor subunit [Ruegeria sp.]
MNINPNSNIPTEGFKDRSSRSIGLGLAAIAALALGFGGWATTARMSGAVVTAGNVVVSSDLRTVQHPDGGIVGDIHVRNGDRVQAGDVVLRLDDQLLSGSQALVDDRLVAIEAQLARLTAERDGLDDLVLSDELMSRKDEAKVQRALASQRAVMDARRLSQDGEVAALTEQITQIEQEITGLEAQRDAAEEEIELIERELAGQQQLLEKGLTPETRVTALKRQRSGLVGNSGGLISRIAVARGRISETRINILQLEKTFREQVMNEISALEVELDGLKERRSAAELQLARVDLRAPADGIVHEMMVHTVGGVVSPGETLMQIVPEGDGLVVTASVMPQDINNVAVGQSASVVIAAFDQHIVSRLDGSVEFVSADLKTDPITGMPYYEARVALDEDAFALLEDRQLNLLPGMPAEVYITTGERTLFEYLIDPLSKQIRTTFREV